MLEQTHLCSCPQTLRGDSRAHSRRDFGTELRRATDFSNSPRNPPRDRLYVPNACGGGRSPPPTLCPTSAPAASGLHRSIFSLRSARPYNFVMTRLAVCRSRRVTARSKSLDVRAVHMSGGYSSPRRRASSLSSFGSNSSSPARSSSGRDSLAPARIASACAATP